MSVSDRIKSNLNFERPETVTVHTLPKLQIKYGLQRQKWTANLVDVHAASAGL